MDAPLSGRLTWITAPACKMKETESLKSQIRTLFLKRKIIDLVFMVLFQFFL